MKPRIAKTSVQKPKVPTADSTDADTEAKPRVTKTEEQKPKKPTTEN